LPLIRIFEKKNSFFCSKAKKMNVLLLGSGGREHAFSHQINQSNRLTQLYIAPGNPGTAQLGINLDFASGDFLKIAEAIVDFSIDLVVVGPEDPLVKGIRDFLSRNKDTAHVPVVGPNAAAARLEGSKDFSKAFMNRHQIPTARSFTVTSNVLAEGIQFLEQLKAPYVLKADGLAAGKGVIIENNLEKAREVLKEMLDGKFGDASTKVVVEEFLSGIEVSCFVALDGFDYILLPEAKDYKRVGEKDSGLNTGGMGAVSPVPFADDVFMQKVKDRIIHPTITGFVQEGIEYIGFLFIGLMNVEGEPYVIEYNCRMGDPETEVVLPRIKSDFLELLQAMGTGKLKDYRLEIDSRHAATIMLVSGGYPESFETGKIISGLEEVKNVLVFHAGTKKTGGNIVTSGGRVMAVTGLAATREKALELSKDAANSITFEKKYFRKDIGFDL
jgi:phosphoribosylamine--glycine ligase